MGSLRSVDHAIQGRARGQEDQIASLQCLLADRIQELQEVTARDTAARLELASAQDQVRKATGCEKLTEVA
jgi:hypothetical protein